MSGPRIKSKIISFLSKIGLKNPDYTTAPLYFAKGVTMELCASDVAHKQIALLGYYEWEISEKIRELSLAGGVMLDVGANYGYYSLLWVNGKTDNRVHAFEPVPANRAKLMSNLSRNRVADRVVVHELALSNTNDTVLFSLENETGNVGWGGIAANTGDNQIQVSTATLDQYASDHGLAVIECVKIDTEGADYLVLQGATHLLQKQAIRHIFYEENLPRMEKLKIKPGSAKHLLELYGYIVESISADEFYAHLPAKSVL